MAPTTQEDDGGRLFERLFESHWSKQDLADRLRDEGADDLARQLEACGDELHLTCCECGHQKVGHVACKKRWCPSCQRQIGAMRANRFRLGADQMQWPLSGMLSHRNEDDASAVFSTLMPAFKRFRRTDFWKKNVRGGLVSYEVTNRSGTWHDHLHFLVDCKWLAVQTPEPKPWMPLSRRKELLHAAKWELTEAWASCLDQEDAVTWVDRAYGEKLMEHVKYTIKGSDLLQCEGRIAPLLRALKGRRLVQPFGNLYGLSKTRAWQWGDEKGGCKCEQCNRTGTMMPTYVVDAHMKRGY